MGAIRDIVRRLAVPDGGSEQLPGYAGDHLPEAVTAWWDRVPGRQDREAEHATPAHTETPCQTH